MNSNMPQSWFDFPVMQTFDPRNIIQVCSLMEIGGANEAGTFTRSTNWLKNVTWINPPMVVSQRGAGTTAFVVASNSLDFDSVEQAAVWNGQHAMTLTATNLPFAVQKIMFLKAGANFVNNIFLDWTGGATSTDVQLGFRDNSVTGGDFVNSPNGTIPVFQFPTTVTYGGTGRQLSVTLLRPGRYSVCLRIIDNGGNFSMFEMEWVVLS